MLAHEFQEIKWWNNRESEMNEIKISPEKWTENIICTLPNMAPFYRISPLQRWTNNKRSLRTQLPFFLLRFRPFTCGTYSVRVCTMPYERLQETHTKKRRVAAFLSILILKWEGRIWKKNIWTPHAHIHMHEIHHIKADCSARVLVFSLWSLGFLARFLCVAFLVRSQPGSNGGAMHI